MPTSSITAAPEVFVSYASRDRDRVLSITERLQSAGVRLWLDHRRIEGGTSWAREIVRGIKACRALMLMCSDAAMRSRAVMQEIQLAWKYELTYLPLLLEATHFPDQLEFFLEGCQWIEVLDTPAETWLTRVLQSLAFAGIGTSAANSVSSALAIAHPTRPKPNLDGLWSVASFTNRIWPLVVEERTPLPSSISYLVRDLRAPQEGVQHRIPLGGRVFWAIEWDHEAHLLLLDEGPEEKVYCLCPSWFIPDVHLRAGVTLLPPESAACEPFVLTGVPGRERLLAILTDQPLGLDWKPPDIQVPARVLSEADVSTLLDRLATLEPGTWTALATYCDVFV